MYTLDRIYAIAQNSREVDFRESGQHSEVRERLQPVPGADRLALSRGPETSDPPPNDPDELEG